MCSSAPREFYRSTHGEQRPRCFSDRTNPPKKTRNVLLRQGLQKLILDMTSSRVQRNRLMI